MWLSMQFTNLRSVRTRLKSHGWRLGSSAQELKIQGDSLLLAYGERYVADSSGHLREAALDAVGATQGQTAPSCISDKKEPASRTRRAKELAEAKLARKRTKENTSIPSFSIG